MGALDDLFSPAFDPSRSNPAWTVASLGEAALSSYPGPALVLGLDGRVVAANTRAEPLRQAIAAGGLESLGRLLAPEAASRPVVESLPTEGGTLILELVALPTRDDTLLVLGRDVTLERNLRSALVDSRQRYKDLVEISSDFAWEVGADGRFAFVSPKGALGYRAEHLVGRTPADFVVRYDASQGTPCFAATLPVVEAEVWMRQSDGSERCLLASSSPILGEDGAWRGARGVCRDVTRERMRDAALARAHNRERLLSHVVRAIRDEVEPVAMLQTAAAATTRALNATGCRIFRLQPDPVPGFVLAAECGAVGADPPILATFPAAEHFDGLIDGWHVLATVTRYRQAANGALCLWRAPDRATWSDDERLLIDDVALQVGLANEQTANHERILRLSRTDSLTGLLNRRAFFEEIARRFQRLQHDRQPAALIYCDLDNFKWVNDVHGHQEGDRALEAVRDLLLRHVRPADLVARLGGDEFALWLDGIGETTVTGRCRAIMEGARTLDRYSGSAERPLRISLGVAVHAGGDGESLDDLVARADRAMYQVKRDGKGDWRLAPGVGG
jgi:diguanylate cyclase (GGDEF)-like protein/PAS domain S-box-containing protein